MWLIPGLKSIFRVWKMIRKRLILMSFRAHQPHLPEDRAHDVGEIFTAPGSKYSSQPEMIMILVDTNMLHPQLIDCGARCIPKIVAVVLCQQYAINISVGTVGNNFALWYTVHCSSNFCFAFRNKAMCFVYSLNSLQFDHARSYCRSKLNSFCPCMLGWHFTSLKDQYSESRSLNHCLFASVESIYKFCTLIID